ncbi:neurotransmitter:Na+ symporter, NSS family [Desulfotomaculum arcticum]|uniref:Transporter n=1 Tax=Desulfotruncus arcticus DSM 17038 TaxID=1121424 RepID=A0A1I2WTA2_9FIRM|nr:sodium-dependent transporter [Desulfotruncus arcticus]SFH03576.1 neurotransmitter:Na+ symporter, NSS family [Desulfotomaculum arcticum] [Desulfotruncus arcticus DSM 17038]
MEQREQWGSRIGFVIAAVGSAVGLGNIWRFPYMVADNGGGIFFLVYLFALLTAGIPIMILEFGIGHKYRGGAPLSFAKMNRKFEWLGWWQIIVCFFIAVYYVLVIAWAMSYVYHSLSLGYADDPQNFFFGNVLGLTGGPFELGGIQTQLLIPLVLAWVITFLTIYTGVKAGIERIAKVLIPILFLMIVIIAVRGITLPGSAAGLNFMFEPDFSRLFDFKVWTAAYGQIFFDLSIAFAIMITYSSYLPKKSDITGNAFATCFTNCGFSLLAGIAVFSILGHMAHSQGVAVKEVAGAGVGLAFVTFPAAIATIGGMAPLFGILFFLALTFAGLTSLISINEAAIAALMDKLDMNRQKVTIIYTGVAAICSLLIATGAGLYILDIVDHFTNNFGIVFGGLLQVLLVGWFFNLNSLQDHINSASQIKAGSWWVFCIKFVTPLVAGYTGIMTLISDIKAPYEGYPQEALLLMGWLVLAVIIAGGFLLSTLKWKNEQYLIEGVKNNVR